MLPFIIRRIHGHSMMPTLPPGTLVLGVSWFKSLKQGRVIIFRRNDREIIKRIQEVNGDEVYVVGDHLDASTDSRHYGTIPKSTVKAVIFWPLTKR